MAVWQADFNVVITRPWPDDYATRLDSCLERSRQLLPATVTWGSEEGNRLDVYMEGGAPSEGLLRLDLRNWDLRFIERILGLLRQWQAGLIAPSGHSVEPVLNEVALASRGSPAFRFVEDPEAFIRRLQLGGLEDV